MTFIPGSGSGSQAIIQATPAQNVVTKNFTSRGAVLPGEQVDLLSNGAVQGQMIPGGPSDNFKAQVPTTFQNNLFTEVNVERSAVVHISGDQYAVCGEDATSFIVVPFTVSLTTGGITKGTSASIVVSATTIASAPTFANVSDNQVVAAFDANSTTATANIVLFSVTGNVATIEDSANVFGTINRVSVCSVGGNKFVVAGSDSDDATPVAAEINVVAGTVTGTTITLGSVVGTGQAGGNVPPYQTVCKLDTDKFLLAFYNPTGTTGGKAIVGTLSGTTITLGSAVNNPSVINVIYGVTQLDTDKALVNVGTSETGFYIITVSGTVPTWGVEDTAPKLDGYWGSYATGFTTQQPIGSNLLVMGKDGGAGSSDLVAIWDFSAVPAVKVVEATLGGEFGSNLHVLGSFAIDELSRNVAVYTYNDIQFVNYDDLSSVYTGKLSLEGQTSPKLATVSTTRAFTYDATNIKIASITSPMSSGAAVLDVDAHSMAGTIQNISKVSSSIAVFSSVNTGAVNLKACENVADSINLGALASFGSGVVSCDVQNDLVVYVDGTQIAMRGLSYSALTISEGAEVQLEASVPSSYSVTELTAGKFLVATDNQVHLVAVSSGVASITSSVAINASDVIDQVSVSGLSATEAALVTRSSTRANGLYAYYITESAGTLAVNAEKVLASVNSALIKVSKVSATSIAIAFKDGADSSKNKVLVANLSGLQFFKAVSLDTYDTAVDTVSLKYIEDEQVLFSDSANIFNLTLDSNTFEVVRSKIGNAKEDGFSGASISVDVFGVALKVGYNNLNVGDSLLNGADTEWAYAVSENEVIQLEA